MQHRALAIHLFAASVVAPAYGFNQEAGGGSVATAGLAATATRTRLCHAGRPATASLEVPLGGTVVHRHRLRRWRRVT
jgi:hypothetical protein